MHTIGIDLGSNTLRAVEYGAESGEFGTSFGVIVKTADGLAQTGQISDAAVERVIAGLVQMREMIPFEGARIRAVTTEAMRRAANGAEALARIAEATGIRFEIIDGDEEARLTLRAVMHRLQALSLEEKGTSPSVRWQTHPAHEDKSLVLIDIGGGSTEVTFAYGEEVIAQSFPLGIVTLSQAYPDLEAIEAVLPEVMEPLERFVAEVYVGRGRPEAFVATAGTPTSVASMQLGMEYDTYDPARINGTQLDRHAPMYYLEELLSFPFARREEIVGVGRADLVTAGILIFERLYRILGFETCVVIDDGLREGVALEMCSE
jgi:exopolyphosphatase/guanosine-5'-triphosphate,3'-diphosphate pyrophosphatase